MILNELKLIPADLYPFFSSTNSLLQQLDLDDSNLKMIHLILCSYYLQAIEEITSQQFFAPLQPFVQTALGVCKLKSLADTFC